MSHCVGPSVSLSVRWSVGRSPVCFFGILRAVFVACYKTYKALCQSLRRSIGPAIDFSAFASGFCITAPAQWHVTDAVVYTALPTAPAHHITAPAQPPQLRVSCIRPCFCCFSIYSHFQIKTARHFWLVLP